MVENNLAHTIRAASRAPTRWNGTSAEAGGSAGVPVLQRLPVEDEVVTGDGRPG